MKHFIFFTFLMLYANTAFSYPPPDSCLKTFDIPEDSTFSNPEDVRVDSCKESSTYREFYGKNFFIAKFSYNIIPRIGLFPEDTIIEYSISDIDTIYTQAIADFQALETEFGTFRFRDTRPNLSDTTTLIKRNLFINFNDYVNIDTAIKRIMLFDCIESIDFRGWFEVISGVETEELYNNLKYNSYSQTLMVTNKLIDRINYLQVYNLNGTEVMKVQINLNHQVIDIGSLKRGVYIIRFGNSIEKIIIRNSFMEA